MSTTAVSAAPQPANMMADIQATLLRKALDSEKESAQELLQTLPQKNPNPPHMGNNLDVYV